MSGRTIAMVVALVLALVLVLGATGCCPVSYTHLTLPTILLV